MESQESKIVLSLAQRECSVHDAVHQLVEVTRNIAAAAGGGDALGDHLTHTFEAVMRAASNTKPQDQAPLVAFVRQLQQEIVVDARTGQPLRFDGDPDKLIWADVPLLGITIADDWNFDPWDPNPSTEEAQCYENKVAFLAQLTASPINDTLSPSTGTPPFDFSLYALWGMRAAFEASTVPRAPTLACLRAACYWLIYTADRLWKNVQTERSFRRAEFNHNPAEEGQAYRKRNWHGFNRPRWDIWIEGVQNAMDGMDADTAELVELALKEVERVMDQGWRIREPERFA